jgi:hypothetical protein
MFPFCQTNPLGLSRRDSPEGSFGNLNIFLPSKNKIERYLFHLSDGEMELY